MSVNNISEYLVTDDLTILLGLIAATVFLVNNLYKPQPLVHPILLGRQSDVGRARNPGESAIYRNYGTGLMGRFPRRPNKDIHILADLVRPETEASRTLWSNKITNIHLQDRVAALRTGILRLAHLQPHESTVLILLDDCLEFIITDMALASSGLLSYTLSSPSLMSAVLDSHCPSAIVTHAFILPHLLEHIYDSGERSLEHTIVVVGEPSPQTMASVASNIKVLKFADVEREGVRVEKILSIAPKPSDIFTISFYESDNGLIQGTQLTHENITAGVAAIHSLLPTSNPFTPLDTLASVHSINTAYGRTIAYAAIFEGTNFATLASAELYQSGDKSIRHDVADLLSISKYPIPSPTVLFLKAGHLKDVVTAINEQASKSWLLHSFAWRHKLSGITDGFVTKESLWDRIVFDSVRTKILGPMAATLRAVVVGGGSIEASLMTPARVALSVPVMNCVSHPLIAGPILASHAFDLQDFVQIVDLGTNKRSPAHSGPPGVNVEVKLVGVDDEKVEAGEDPVGVLFVRGPPVGKMVNVEGYVDVPSGSNDENSWTGTGLRAKVQANGSFQLITN